MSQTRFLKSMITSTKVEPTSSDTHIAGVASGVWSLQDQLEARRGGTWPDANVDNPDTLIENNFSIDVYVGTGAAKNIVNGLDMSGKGGMIWGFNRDLATGGFIYDTVRGKNNYLESFDNDASAAASDTTDITSFNDDGFSLGGNYTGGFNRDGNKQVTFSFKKAPNFFDIVTYTGTGSARTISHSLGGTVGMIMVKNLSQADNWTVYHRGMDDSAPQNYDMHINTQDSRGNNTSWNDTAPTSSVFSVGTSHEVNADGENYVAYLFAHNTGADSIIKCDKFTADSSGEASVDLGFEPQFLMIKNRQSADDWMVNDTMRGYFASNGGNGDDGQRLRWNLEADEDTTSTLGHPNATGFATNGDGPLNNHTYVYMAIRRPIMGIVTDATKVFAIATGAGTPEPTYVSGFPVDMAIERPNNNTQFAYISSRLTGNRYLKTGNQDAQATDADIQWDFNTGYHDEEYDSNNFAWMWRRAKGYFDAIAYTGNATSGNTKSHNLGVAPEMMWVKNREASNRSIRVYHSSLGATKYVSLDANTGEGTNSTMWNDTAPSSTVITLGSNNDVNSATERIIAYLFATLAGVSKVGGFTHTNGSSTDVDCGFTSGARFVLYKRYKEDGSAVVGNWRLFDTTRGIVSGTETPFHLDTNEYGLSGSDLIDPLSSGFQIASGENSGNYLFYAIA